MNHFRRSGAFLALPFLVVLAAANVGAQDKSDPTGSWQLRVVVPGRPPNESTLKLEKAAGKLIGVVTDAQGRSSPIKDAEMKNGELSFRIRVERGGREINFRYSGKVAGDTFKGKVIFDFSSQKRTFDFEGKRVKDDATLTGTWKIMLHVESGEKLQPSMRLKQEGTKVTGEYIGTSGKEIRIPQVEFKAGELRFKVAEQFDEEKVLLDYQGKVVGDKIAGTVQFGSGTQKTNLKFDAQKLKTPTANLNGTWKLMVRLKSGENFEPTLKLAQMGLSLNGSYLGEQGETPISEAVILGDEFTFEVNRDREGKKYKLRYQGRVKGDTLKGNVDYNFDGIVGFVEFEGKRIAR